jgi:serine/threonine protein phosphatase PrpC
MNNSDFLWRCVGETIRGASHERGNLPNQDAIEWYPGYPNIGDGLPLILAISDGHGSRKNFRSDQGSKLAVQTAIKVLQELFLGDRVQAPSDAKLLGNSEYSDTALIADIAKNRLPQKLVHEWTQAVEHHWQQTQLSPTEELEWQQVQQEWERSVKNARPDPHLDQPLTIPYGATLLAVLVTEQFTLYLQLGDGDILCVSAQDQVSSPFERDPRLIANETTSLCTPNAWRDIRVKIQFHAEFASEPAPILILLATDGYANSFSSSADFQKIGSDYREMIVSSGLKKVTQSLNQYLHETSQEGSGDDITLGIIKRLEDQERDHLMIKTQQVREESNRKIEQIGRYQKKNDSAIRFLAKGLIAAFTLLIASLGWCGWLTSQIVGLKQKNTELEQKLTLPSPASSPPTEAPRQSNETPADQPSSDPQEGSPN